MKNYVTSYFEDEATKLGITDNLLSISMGQSLLGNKDILVSLCNSRHLEILKVIITLKNCNGILSLPEKIDEGIYFIQIYLQISDNQVATRYLGMFFCKDIPICFHKGCYQFVNTVVYANNHNLFKNISLPSLTSQIRYPEIVALSKTITTGLSSGYKKVLAIHDWVASEIYYDLDALKNRTYINNDNSALGVLKNRKTVCQGYTNLTVALLLAIGIPSRGLSCFSLGVSTTGGWELDCNLSSESNHIIPIVFFSNRWIIMDVTWDSDNEYIDGKFIKRTGFGLSRKYFDVTLEFISNTHRFTK